MYCDNQSMLSRSTPLNLFSFLIKIVSKLSQNRLLTITLRALVSMTLIIIILKKNPGKGGYSIPMDCWQRDSNLNLLSKAFKFRSLSIGLTLVGNVYLLSLNLQLLLFFLFFNLNPIFFVL